MVLLPSGLVWSSGIISTLVASVCVCVFPSSALSAVMSRCLMAETEIFEFRSLEQDTSVM